MSIRIAGTCFSKVLLRPLLCCASLLPASLGAAQFTLTWDDNSDDEDGFKVERAEGAGAFAPLVTLGANVENYVDNTAVDGTKYTYRVYAYNTIGNSTFTNVVTNAPTFTTQPVAAQSVPAFGTATFTVAVAGIPSPTFQWRKNGVNLANGGIVSGATLGTLTLTGVSLTDADTYTVAISNSIESNVVSSASVLSVIQATQTITFPTIAAKTFGDAGFNPGASSDSGLTISYASSNTAVATVSGSTVTIVGAGTATITASQAGDSNYLPAASVQRTLTVNKATQTITFGTITPVTFGASSFGLGATASSGLAVSYASSSPTVATVSGSTLTPVGGGSTNITASQAGNANYNPATSVIQAFTVNKADQVISFGSLATMIVGDVVTLSASSTSGLAVTFGSNALSVATVSGTSLTAVGAGAATITAQQTGNANYNAAPAVGQPLQVNRAPTFSAQPTSRTISALSTTNITVAASGTPAPTFQWQVSLDGGLNWANLTNVSPYSGVTTTTLTITAAPGTLNGNLYRALAANSVATTASTAMTLTVTFAPTISLQPANAAVIDGQGVSFGIVAAGSPAPTYQWQVSTNGGSTWSNLADAGIYSGVTTPNLAISAVSTALQGNRYRCIATNTINTATSNGAILTVNFAPSFTAHPGNRFVVTGGTTSFTAAATGNPTPSFQWQVSTAPGGSTFVNLSNNSTYAGATSATLSISGATAALRNLRYRVLASNSVTAVASEVAVLNVGAHLPASDMDGDGQSDLLIQGTAGERLIWRMTGATMTSSIALPTFTAGWHFAGTGDFDGDGRNDIVLQNTTTGEHVIWKMNAGTISGSLALPTLPLTWRISCVGDLDNDGRPDIVLQNMSTNERVVWIMNGASITRSVALPTMGISWQISGIIDFSGDNKADVLLENTASGARIIWVMNGDLAVSSTLALPTFTAGWRFAGVGYYTSDGLPNILLQHSSGARVLWSIATNGTIAGSTGLPELAASLSFAGAALNLPRTAPSDLDGDGQSDLLLENSSGDRVIWRMNGTSIAGSLGLPTLTDGWHFAGIGDFDRDGKNDIVLRNSNNGSHVIWTMDGGTITSSLALPTLPLSWRISTVGDLDNDGNPDIVLQNIGTNDRVVWMMDGPNIARSVGLPRLSTAWHIAGILDFSGDTRPDILLENTATGARVIWVMNADLTINRTIALPTFTAGWRFASVGYYTADQLPNIVLQNANTGDRVVWSINTEGTITGSADLPTLPVSWSFAGSALNRTSAALADFNGDGQSDILLTETVSGDRVIWTMNGTAIGGSLGLPTLPAEWQFAGNGDFNADGQTDIVLQNTTTGDRVIWLMNGAAIAGSAGLPSLPVAWQIAAIGDINVDGQPDIVLQNAGTGARMVWTMSGTSVSGTLELPTLPTSWQIAAAGMFTNDGRANLLLENTSTGDRLFWVLNADASIAGSIGLPTFLGGWRFAGTGDFYGSGKPHILLQNTSSGERVIWQMSDTSISSSTGLPTLPTSWIIRN